MYYAKNLYINNKKVDSEITIPNDITKIPNYAFYGCDSITRVTIPNSLTNIGYSAFGNCSGLKEVYYNGSYKDVGKIKIESYNNYFMDSTIHCSDFTANKWGICGDMVAYFLDDNGTLTISGTGKMADASLFDENGNIKSVVIENGITHIGSNAFSGCRNLTSVTIPSSVTSAGSGAFFDCKSLDSVYITDFEAYLNTNFYHYTTSNDMEYNSDFLPYGSSGSNPMYYANKLYVNGKRVAGKITIPDGITKIPYAAFDGCDGITNIIIPDSVTSIGSNAFSGCTGLTGVYITDLSAWCNINFNPNRYYRSNSNPLLCAHNLYLNNKLVTDLVIPDNVTSINEGAFSGCSSLKSATIPDGVTKIDIGMFSDCNNMTSITIPDSVTSINDYAFSGCNSLINITLPDSITSIGRNAFSDCSGLKSINIPNGVENISHNVFSGCTGLTNVTIPNNVTSIGGNAFNGCSSLKEITIPSSITDIGNYAFGNCSGLTTIYYNAPKVFSNIFKATEYSYSNSSNLMLAVLGNNVTGIDVNAFSSCKELKKIFIPQSMTEIEKDAFSDCSNLTIVEYGGSQSDWAEIYIGANENLTNAKINYNSTNTDMTLTDLDYLTYTKNDDNTITIADCNTAATNINIPNKIDGLTVTAIGSNAFSDCNKLTTVTIPKSVTSIGYLAFDDCDKLKDVYYTGTEKQWKSIDISWDNDNLTNVTMHYNGVAPTPKPTSKPTPIPTPTPKPTPKPTPIPTTTATITKTETDTTYNFVVAPEATYANCYVYAAVYDENGVLLGVNRVPLEMTGNTTVSVDKSANDAFAKVFIWANTLQPIITAEEFPLI